MTFSEKLNYLMDVMNTKGYELSKATGMSTSSISQLKNGLRKKPQKAIKYKEIAKFFAEHCTAEYQRTALAQATGNPTVMTTKSNGELTDIILSWLVNESDSLTNFISNVSNYSHPPFSEIPVTEPQQEVPDLDSIQFFKGLKGKREAFRLAINKLLSLESPGEILVSFEDYSYWLYEEPEFSTYLKSSLFTLINRGFSITYIINSTDKTGNAYAECTFWMPILISGKANICYYPRIRDGLYKHSIICADGVIALFCNNISDSEEQDLTTLSTNPEFVSSISSLYHSVLCRCLPAVKILENNADIINAFNRFLAAPGREIRKTLSLSLRTLPKDVFFEYLHSKYRKADCDTFAKYLDMIKEDDVSSSDQLVEITTLATAQQVRKGHVPIIYPGSSFGMPMYYTPYTYCMHLKEIVRKLEQCPTYYFIPIPYMSNDNLVLFLKEGRPALIHTYSNDSSVVAEISNPDLITIFWEYLHSTTFKVGLDDLSKMEVISQLKHLISELE